MLALSAGATRHGDAGYPGRYARFAEPLRTRRSGIDRAPPRLVADAFLRGVRPAGREGRTDRLTALRLGPAGRYGNHASLSARFHDPLTTISRITPFTLALCGQEDVMDASGLRRQAASLDACAIRFEALDVAQLLRRYADEARARAMVIEMRARRDAVPRMMS